MQRSEIVFRWLNILFNFYSANDFNLQVDKLAYVKTNHQN